MKKNRIALMLTLASFALAAAGCSAPAASAPTTAPAPAETSAPAETTAPAAETSAKSPVPAETLTPASSAAAPTGQAGGAISQEDAKAKALEAAKVAEADALAITVQADREDGRPVYSVDIYTPLADYEYELDQATGDILSMDQESYSMDWAAPEGAAVSKEDAAASALGKVPGASQDNLRMKPDFDDGRSVYEGEIIYQDKSYDFKIDCQSGDFLEWGEELLAR